MRQRDIRTDQPDVSCDVCGRTLLRGERTEAFLAGGSRRQVCELCVARATHEGWIRESGAAEALGARPPRQDRGRGLLGRLRGRREPAEPVEALEEEPLQLDPALEAELAEHPVVTERRPRQPDPAPAPREPRHVRAVPTNAELKMERALEVFNVSQHPRTVAGVARSLGAPGVCVRTHEEQPSVVEIVVMWELSWYRYEVDLSDEAGGAQRVGQGAELDELGEAQRVVNGVADERGQLSLATATA